MQKKEYSIEIDGKKMTAIFSDLVDQANGAVMLKYGETVILATAVMSKEEKEGLDFFNLTVDYLEKFYASGKILGSRYNRREGRPSDEAILNSRIIDRTIRPLFNQSMKNAVQVVVTVLSLDKNDPTFLAVNAASLAIASSNIPWNGPVGAIRITGKEDSLFINPEKKEESAENLDYDFSLFICGKDKNINMIEAISHQVNSAKIKLALEKASEEITKLEEFQKQIIKEMGKEKKIINFEKISSEKIDLFNKKIAPKLSESVFSGPGKEKIHNLHEIWLAILKEKYPEQEKFNLENEYFEEKINALLHQEAINNNKRADGRKMNELRNIFTQAGNFSEIIHGSGIFYRGGTHVLSVLTLGGPEDVHLIDSMEVQKGKRFMHYYNFPPYSTGEVGRVGMTGRREIGHGALAEKALSVIIPDKEVFPYTIRLVSETMASNGSSSMGSVCASTLALMDGGVPIKAPVAGIAMGLMYQDEKNYKILTDIQGPEDEHGDMDFKMAGTKNGITAIQLDVKVEGVPIFILAEAMEQAKEAYTQILEKIEKEIATPRPDISKHAPKILTTKVKIDQIGLVIGPGGKTINGIKDKTGAEITIEDDGTVFVTGKNGSAEEALQIIKDLTHVYALGEELKVLVVKIVDFGAFVKLNASTEGLVHISEIAPFRVNNVSDILKEGDIVPVKIIKIDNDGKIGLSIKAANPDFAKDKNNQNAQ